MLTAIRNDLLGISQQKIPIKKLAKKFGLEDPSYLQEAVEALAYLILHICKINASEEEFFLIYQQSGLNQQPQFSKTMFDIIYPYIGELRDILKKENDRDTVKFSDLDWRLSMVTATRSKQKIMVPKYTVKMDVHTANAAANMERGAASEEQQLESIIFDSDYNNMKRLQDELQTALKSLNGRYSKKVFKFLK